MLYYLINKGKNQDDFNSINFETLPEDVKSWLDSFKLFYVDLLEGNVNQKVDVEQFESITQQFDNPDVMTSLIDSLKEINDKVDSEEFASYIKEVDDTVHEQLEAVFEEFISTFKEKSATQESLIDRLNSHLGED